MRPKWSKHQLGVAWVLHLCRALVFLIWRNKKQIGENLNRKHSEQWFPKLSAFVEMGYVKNGFYMWAAVHWEQNVVNGKKDFWRICEQVQRGKKGMVWEACYEMW